MLSNWSLIITLSGGNVTTTRRLPPGLGTQERGPSPLSGKSASIQVEVPCVAHSMLTSNPGTDLKDAHQGEGPSLEKVEASSFSLTVTMRRIMRTFRLADGRVDDDVREATVTIVHRLECLIDLPEREDLVLEDREVERARIGHGGHVLTFRRGEPQRADKRRLLTHQCVRLEKNLERED